jgi:radical SAM superfamily enzyme YgiQ (UPF0313 family)
MNRKYSVSQAMETIKKLHNNFNLPYLGCDIIVGFPDENEEDFIETFENLKKAKLSSIHCFPYSKREKNYLILDFIEKNYVHNKRYKGGLTYKTFAFSDDIRYKDVDLFRKIIKKIYTLNGRISSIESSNVFVYQQKINDKEQSAINVRNSGRERIKPMEFEAFLNMLGDLPEIDFSTDVNLIKEHRIEAKRQRDVKRAEQRKLRYEKLKAERAELNAKKQDASVNYVYAYQNVNNVTTFDGQNVSVTENVVDVSVVDENDLY